MLERDSGDGEFLARRSSRTERKKSSSHGFPGAFLGRIIEESPEAMAVMDDGGRIVLWNRAAERLFCIRKSAIIGRRVMDFLPGELREAREPQLKEFLRAGKGPSFGKQVEVTIRRKGGSVATVEVMVAHVKTDGTYGAVITARDVTDRKAAEEALKESESRFRTLMKMPPEAITATDLKGTITEISDRTLRLHGYDNAAELIGKSAFVLIAEEDRRRACKNMGLTLKRGYIGNLEYSLMRKDGSRFVGEMDVSRFDDAHGRPAGYLAAVRDVTERKRLEDRLRTQYSIASITSESASMDEAAPKILRAVCRSMGWDWGELWAVDRETKTLRCVEIWHGKSVSFPAFERATRETTFGRGAGVPGRVWAGCAPVWVPDVTKDKGFVRMRAAAKGKLHASFAFPVTLGNEVIGVMVFLSREIREPDEGTLHAFATLGRQIGQFYERKRVEASLRDSEERFRKVFEEGPLGMAMVGLDNRFIRANRAVRKIWGYSEDELRRMTFADITHPAEAARDLAAGRRLLKGEIPFYRVDKRYIRKDKEVIWAAIHVSIIRDARGRPLYFLAMVDDITDHKSMEDALMESEKRYRSIVENSHEVVMLTRPDGTISYLSPACEEVLGYRPEELIGKEPWIIHPDDTDKVKRIFDRARGGEGGSNVEYRVLAKSGDAKWVSHSWSPIFDGTRLRMVVSVVRDISERKKMESFRKEYYLMVEKEISAKNRELRERKEELESKSRLLDEFKRLAMKKENELAALRREVRRLRM